MSLFLTHRNDACKTGPRAGQVSPFDQHEEILGLFTPCGSIEVRQENSRKNRFVSSHPVANTQIAVLIDIHPALILYTPSIGIQV